MLGDVFDPKADFLIHERCRPHWSQAGAVVFITFRTHDSIPQDVIKQWEREKQEWLRLHGYAGLGHWSEAVQQLPENEQARFRKQFQRCREEFLDTCHGECLLRRPELAQIVADSLLHFDGVRYRLGDFVVMPNHVHLLAVFGSPEGLTDQCQSWLHFTATQINRVLDRRGKFWQQEPFDHLVRSVEQYDYLRRYIAENPLKARLTSGKYLYRRYNG